MSNIKYTIDNAKEFAKQRDGKCLSNKYCRKLQWQCSKNHTWYAPFTNIRNGHWCAKCAGNKRLSIEDIHKFAKSKGGKLLSNIYKNNSTLYNWQCVYGHIWPATFDSIQNMKTWCPECSGYKKHCIEDMYKFASLRNGKCLSSSYINNKTLLKWQCKCGHIWNASYHTVSAGCWCPKCSPK